MVNPLNAGKAMLKMKKVQDQMKSIRAKGQSDNGRVKITLNGLREIEDIEIIDELLDPSKKDMLKKAFISAFKDASKALEKESRSMMESGDIKKIMEMFS